MKFNYLFFFFTILVCSNSQSQTSNKVLFTINREPTYEQEFIKAYSKNLKIVSSEKKENLSDFLELYINFKLKVKEAEELKLDTLQSFKNELHQYKIDLASPYLKDTTTTNNLIKEAYNKLQKEINVSHILIFLKPDASAQDTLAAYNKLLEARKLIESGAKFADVAKKYSQDPTVKDNGGNIGYFTALQLVYPFENRAYSTPIDSISMPFRTKFGFHILKVIDVRPARGEVEVAHIMIKNDTLNAKRKIDSIYNLLKLDKANFSELAKQVSEDLGSASNGGKLPKFGTGKMIEEFANVAFSLKNENEISKPFKSRYGWHIIQLIKKYPIQSFAKMEPLLAKQVENDERSNIINENLISEILKLYKVQVNQEALNQFNNADWKMGAVNLNSTLLTIDKTTYSQKDFINYLKTMGPNISIGQAFESFKNKLLIEYYKNNLENTNADFAASYKEFREGLLLFNLLEKEVWNKSKDSIGLLKYFNSNKSDRYKMMTLNDNKGTIISDYQNWLESELIDHLRKKYKIVVNTKLVDTIQKSVD